MKLGLDFSSAGADGSQQRQEFERQLVQNLSHASGLPPANFKVKQMLLNLYTTDQQLEYILEEEILKKL
jgi:hypothetical protein